MDYIEIIGIVATLFVLCSFILRGEWKIRLVNSFGALLFVIYGIFIQAWSVWILNIALIVIHIYYLTRKPKIAETQEKLLEEMSNVDQNSK